MTANVALPEKYRRSTSIRVGYQIRSEDGRWLTVTDFLHILAPLNFVRLGLDDGTCCNLDPRGEVMSRRLATERTVTVSTEDGGSGA